MIFLKQAYKGKTNWWRWLLILGIFAPYTFRNYLKKELHPLFKSLPEGKENSLILDLSLYLIILPLLILLFKFIHQRDFFTVVTIRKKFDWIRFLLSFATWGIFIIILLSISIFLEKEVVSWNIKIFSFIKLLVICLLLVPVRAFFEDVLFKEYSLQFLVYYVKFPWIAILINAIITSVLMHIVNTYLFNLLGFQILVYYFAVNLLSCIIVVLDGGLEIILGMKIGNNLSLLLFTTLGIYSDYDKSASAAKTESAIILITYFSVYVGFPLYYFFLKKTYNWNNWKEKLFTIVKNNNS